MNHEYPIDFGKYILTKRIAVGGMAEVFKAKLQGAKGFEKTLALKKILPEYSSDEEFLTMFIDEARISSSLAHPNIVQVFDFGEFGHQFYLAMEYIDGSNLKNLFFKNLRSGHQLKKETVYYIIQKMASALEYAHNVQLEDHDQMLHLVHRDVSPQNILISRLGEVKITDFGIAKAAIKLSQTQPGKIQGKYSYMSPEQALGKKIDHRSDIFSLGIIFYELLSNRKVYGSSDTVKRYKQATKAEIPRIGGILDQLPSQIDELITKMLSPKPEDRPQSCGEIVALLSEFLSSHSTDTIASQLGNLVGELFPPERSVSQNPGAQSHSDPSQTDPKGYFLQKKRKAKKTPSKKAPKKLTLLRHQNPWLRAGIGVLFVPLGSLIAWTILHQSPQTLPPAASVAKTEPSLEAPDPEPESSEHTQQPSNEEVDYSSMTMAQLSMELSKVQSELRNIEQITDAYLSIPKAKKVSAPKPPPSCPNDMVMIQASSFWFGSSPEDPDRMELVEFEAQEKTLPSFCIDPYEYPNKKGEHPKVGVSFEEASQLCTSHGKRLCKDTEWERACKASASENIEFPYAQQWEQNPCNTGGQLQEIVAAGDFESCKTRDGLFDMIGNVEEWTQGQGRLDLQNRVIKGGSLESPKYLSRCSALKESASNTRSNILGFRCCRNLR
ncbi:MAG: protein kinase [Bdellovibrionales bacterium]|nr:protein kinase [Bdellovibrionales bacterium]